MYVMIQNKLLQTYTRKHQQQDTAGIEFER